MKTLTILSGCMLLAVSAFASPAFARSADNQGCVQLGGSKAASSVAGCKGGPLQPGDPRLGAPVVPRAAERGGPAGNSFQVGGSSVTISGSVRVEGVFSR
ncbi:hypothetical protein [Pseudochelatococcus contaminans]|uniref:Uncharacterized protein n=1 Tax=Pseudochelatococcus contaminans TaxID=1538103 RepID=A0A7W5Z251_9HYPH|nr:hypothetical protein [Pseudochelatococcus contaminans]MBB3808662.1 hypothetical protein [Pseudochelatococcus contaminans]